MKEWRPFSDCDFCGSGAEALTASVDDETASVDDEARCPHCGERGVVMADDGGDCGGPVCGYIEWFDSEAEED